MQAPRASISECACDFSVGSQFLAKLASVMEGLKFGSVYYTLVREGFSYGNRDKADHSYGV